MNRFDRTLRPLLGALALVAIAACSSPSAPAPVPGPTPAPAPAPAPVAPPVRTGLPPVEPRTGALAIQVVYPNEGQTLAVRDSNFIFGNVGTGGASLTIDGIPVEVAPNGAFLAYIPVPADGRYDVIASANGQTAESVRTVRFPTPGGPATPPPPRDPNLPPPPSVDAPRVAVADPTAADRLTVGVAVPGGGSPYNWFFPPGTRLTLTGQQGYQYRARLTDDLSIWVDTAAVELQPVGTPSPRGTISNVTATPQTDYVDVRLSTSERLPFKVDGTERGLTVTVYGAQSRTNIVDYGSTDPLIRSMDWDSSSENAYKLQVNLNEPLWGFRPFYDERGYLIVRVMRTPRLDPVDPLRGLFIAIDAGHPPGGAIGPTALTEAEATLAVAKRLIPLLQARGARIMEVRPDATPIDVNERTRRVQEAGAQLFVSIHFDAFGDGTNPFRNYGTHVLFNQPQSIEFARALQRELLRTTGLPDLGVRKQDVAVIRNPMMPAVLTETLFMMFPQQEAALRNPEGLQQIAEAHVRGIEAFLRARMAQLNVR